MELSDRAGLSRRAREVLAQANPGHYKLVLLHTGGILAVDLLMTLVLYLIGSQVEDTGGLSGLQTRALWATVENVLLYVIPLATLLWNAGYFYLAMGLARGKKVTARDLFAGFRRPISVLGCYAWPGLQYFARGVLCVIVATTIFSFTPLVQPVAEIMQNAPTKLVDGEVMFLLDEQTQAALMPHMIPVIVLAMVLFIPVALRLYYRFRLGLYLLLDGQERGCMTALRGSRLRMAGRSMEMFRLDLHFWWYYVLQGCVLALFYMETWLPMLGVQLPPKGLGMGILVFSVYAVAQLAVDLLAKNWVETTYAQAYEAILRETTPENQ